MLTTRSLSITYLLGLLALTVALAGACSGKSSSSACDGKERCACYANLTCNVGLVCLSDICVAPVGAGGNGVGGTATALVLQVLGVIEPNLLAAYSSNLFGITCVAIVKIP